MTLERVIVIEQDPTAVRAAAFTYRSKRGDSYKTNATLSLMQQWGNNVTFAIYYKTSDNILIRTQLCGLIELSWFMNLVVKFSDIPKRCPVLAKEYHITNLELRPQNFPFPLPSGEHYIGTLLKQDNRKVILNIRGTIHVKEN